MRNAVKQLLGQMNKNGQQKAESLTVDELEKRYDKLHLHTVARREAALPGPLAHFQVWVLALCLLANSAFDKSFAIPWGWEFAVSLMPATLDLLNELRRSFEPLKQSLKVSPLLLECFTHRLSPRKVLIFSKTHKITSRCRHLECTTHNEATCLFTISIRAHILHTLRYMHAVYGLPLIVPALPSVEFKRRLMQGYKSLPGVASYLGQPYTRVSWPWV